MFPAVYKFSKGFSSVPINYYAPNENTDKRKTRSISH